MEDVLDVELVEQLLFDHIQDNGGTLGKELRGELENVRSRSDDWRELNENDELSVIERRVRLSDASRELLSCEHELLSRSNASSEREVLVKRSNQFSMDAAGDLFAKMFPHLFPYGRGHPGESRRVTVSLKECIKHYTLLSGRHFAEDELFTLVAFDRILMKNMYTNNSLRCQRFPGIYDGYDAIGENELGKALLENEQRRHGQRPNHSRQGSLAHKFLKTVEIASGAVWGSNAERAKCRQKAFAYQTRFGQPSLFVTLTPNTDNSLVTAHYAGISSVDTLFDILGAPMPSKTELREASMGNDCASTRIFLRSVNAFIKHVLGIDPVTRKQMPFAGLLGKVEAFFGMVETQGRGTLHIHFLIWLEHAPSSTDDLESALNDPRGCEFRESIEAYVNSIVSTELPLAVGDYLCANCGASFSELVGINIPQRARQNRWHGLHNRAHNTKVEPALMQGSACLTKLSSQHILRSVLLQNRPAHWPPWERHLTVTEIDDVAKHEAVCRGTLNQAIDIVNEREKTQMHLRSECTDFADECGIASTSKINLLKRANAPQMVPCKSDDDPFQNDDFTRLIEMLPPMSSDNRMTRREMDYLVSVLVVLLNQHWWCHTSSYFKASKATPNDSFCRYLFPRDLCPKTVFDVAGVLLERKLAHEFINGFNYKDMTTFRCNHDIQFLLGEKDAADRIHYCTKYVTEQQRHLDSVVVVALAAFRRRQERENIDACLGKVTSADALATARKRVASMVYTMTNRQEVAGPLAALYLYRGSCSYESTECSYLPLGDIVRQLCSIEEYSCRLVNESGDAEAPHYLVVSFLDDYIYRPDDLNTINIYEFAMQYFRKKDAYARLSKFTFKSVHPLHGTHSLAKRRKNVVPVLQGFRVPYVTEPSSKETRYKRAVLSLVLFKPFRTLSDLIGTPNSSDELWLDSFAEWEPRSKFVMTIMRHIDDYYCGADRAKARVDQMKTQATGSAVDDPIDDSDDDSSDESDSLFSDGEYVPDADCVAGTDTFINPWEIVDTDGNSVPDSQTLNPVQCPTTAAPGKRISHILDVFKSQKMLDGCALSTVEKLNTPAEPEYFPTVSDVRKWVLDGNTDNKLLLSSPTEVHVRDTQVIGLLDDALAESNMSWWNSPSDPPPQPRNRQNRFATVAAISQEFTLNLKQHHAFQLIGTALLKRWKKTEEMTYVSGGDLDEFLQQDQLRLFLGGEGGTGKSRVLDAVQALCDSWNRSECLVKTALTGKAATMLSGRTLASFLLQLRMKRRVSSSVYLDILVIDEVSMMRKTQLAQLD